MRRVGGILISHLKNLKLRNLKYLFKVTQPVRTVSGFEPRPLEDKCLESKWKIEKVKGLELFENIHPLFFLIIVEFIYSTRSTRSCRYSWEDNIFCSFTEEPQVILLLHQVLFIFFFSRRCLSSMGHLPDKEENSVNCKEHPIRCVFKDVFLCWHSFLFYLKVDVYFHSVDDLLIDGSSG